MTLPPVAAQSPPANVKEKLIEQGWRDFGSNQQANQKLYDQALAASAPKNGVKITKDLAYGKHPRQKVDVYQPEGKTNLPILVFVHGGNYVGGAREPTPLVNANIMYYFTRNGFVGVNADYRVAPRRPEQVSDETPAWPAQAEDVRSAVRWLKENAIKYGGNPDRIYLFGASAGADDIANYVFDRRLQPESGPGVAGVILMSGLYKFEYDPDNPYDHAMEGYLGVDAKAWAERSPVAHVSESNVPVMLVTVEFDQLGLEATTGDLFRALCYRDGGRCPRLVQLKYHNHSSEVYHFNSGDDFLGREIVEWVKEGFGTSRKRHAQPAIQP
jgi:acetyl esterase/lipase